MDDLREIKGFMNQLPTVMSIGVAGVNIDGNKVLLVKNVKADYWSFPGGHLHEEESLIVGLKREIFEETKNQIEIMDGPVFYQYKLNEKLHLLLFFYRIRFKDSANKYSSINEEVIGAKWFDINKLPRNIYENTKTIIDYRAV